MADNRKAFLDMIAFSEGTKDIGDDGYNVIVGSTKENPDLFESYADHPRQRVYFSKLGIYSTAAGRYQILERYFDAYKSRLCLPDFSPASQDTIALQQIKERGALAAVDAGDFDTAVLRCNSIWSSFPGAGYGQREQKITDLRAAYVSAGGGLA